MDRRQLGPGRAISEIGLGRSLEVGGKARRMGRSGGNNGRDGFDGEGAEKMNEGGFDL